MSASYEQVCLIFGETENKREVSYDEYDPKNIVFEPVSVKDGEGFTVTTIPVYYRCPDGKLRGLNFAGAPQTVAYGISECYKIGTKEEDRSPDNLNGFQMCYPLFADTKHPTREEKLTKQIFDDLWKLGKAHIKKIVDEEGEEADNLPENLIPLVNTPSGGFKPPYDYPKKKDPKNPKKKVSDTDKVQQSYIKLKSFGAGADLKVSTKLYYKGSNKMVPIAHESKTDDKYMLKGKPIPRAVGQRAKADPYFSVKGIFLGGHGTTPYGASLQIKLHEADWYPLASSDFRMSRKKVDADALENSDDEDSVKATFGSSNATTTNDDWGNEQKPSKASALKAIPVSTNTPADEDDEPESGSDPDEKPSKPVVKPKLKAKAPINKKK